MDWTAIRDDYPGLARSTYLNSCSLGQISQGTMSAYDTFREQWLDMGAAAWYEVWMDEIAAWRTNMARLLGVGADEVAWIPSVSVGLSTLASALARPGSAWSERQDVVAGELEFPTAVAAFGTRPDTTMRWARSPDAIHVPTEAYASAIQANGGARAVVASRVFYSSGHVQPVADICRAATDAGAFAIVDDYQGAGQLPSSGWATGADAIVGGGLKWLCAGMGSCFMAVRREHHEALVPQHSGWWADEGMFDFDTEHRLWSDARRFETGEVNMHGVVTMRAATDDLLRIGIDRIRDRNRELTRDLLDRLADAGHTVRVRNAASHSALVMVEHDDPKGAVKRLDAAGITVDDRPGCVRVSPHFYNTEEENEAFVAGLAS